MPNDLAHPGMVCIRREGLNSGEILRKGLKKGGDLANQGRKHDQGEGDEARHHEQHDTHGRKRSIDTFAFKDADQRGQQIRES